MRIPIRFSLFILWIAAAPSSPAGADEPWPQFRGAGGQGNCTAANLPLTWSESENVSWKRALPGKGWSSPVIGDGQIWVTTAIEQSISEEEKQRKLAGVKDAKQRHVPGGVVFRAICLELKEGKFIHDLKLFEEDEPNPIHTLNSYASPTPVLEDGRLYCHFGTYGTACVDTTSGDIVWDTRLPLAHYVGPGSSPVVYEDLLILTCDGADQQYVAALNKRTGEEVWKTDRPPIRATDGDVRKAYCTPLVIRHNGQDQVVIPGAQWVVSYDPATGRELWRADHGRGFSNVPRPVYRDGTVYICTGFTKPELWAIRVDGRGDVTGSHILWKFVKQVPKKPSPVLAGDRLYLLSDQGIATCLNTSTQSPHWTKRVSGNYSASPLLVAAPGERPRIYFFSHEGKTTVLAESSEFEVLAVNQLSGQHMASAAVADGALFLRTDTHLYRVER